MAILVFAGVLSVPSAVFAEASWYGSLRAGVASSDSNISVFDAGARWGIKGSAEAGEGLTAVYRFEHKINTAEASLTTGGRLSYVGLSGGFGTVTVGQIWSAAYNSFGAVTDNSWFWGDAETSYRHSNAISYAFSNDLMSLQTDLIYDSPDALAAVGDTVGETTLDQAGADNANAHRNRENLQETQFGLSINIGEIGKVALAYTDDKYVLAGADAGLMTDAESPVTITVPTSWRSKETSVAAEVSVANLTAYVGSGKKSYTNTTAVTTQTAENQGSAAVKADDKTTFFGIRGGLGDTGLSYTFQWRDVKNSHKPWILNLTKGLGDSASLVFEHSNNDGDSPNKSGVALAIGF